MARECGVGNSGCAQANAAISLPLVKRCRRYQLQMSGPFEGARYAIQLFGTSAQKQSV